MGNAMTQDEIIEMAKHIANTFGTRMCDEQGETHGEELYAMGIDDIVQTIKLVAAQEREACAKECEHTALRMGSEWMAQHCAEAIRARGEA